MADADISNFVGITGASAPVAKGFLELTNGDFEQAVQLFFDNPDLQHSIGSSATPPARPPVERDTSLHRGASVGDPIYVDNDDDFSDNDDDVRTAARDAQAAEDEAEARRLQEQEYSGGPGPDEGVRSPIRGTTDTLVGPDPWGRDSPDIGPPNPVMGFRNSRNPQGRLQSSYYSRRGSQWRADYVCNS